MKRFLVIICFILFCMPASILAKDEIRTDTTFEILKQRIQYADLLISHKRYDEAIGYLNKTEEMVLNAFKTVNQEQMKSILLQVELEKKKQHMNLLRWRNDSLSIHNKIMEEQSRKGQLQKISAEKELMVQKVKLEYLQARQKKDIAAAVNENTSSYLKHKEQADSMRIFIVRIFIITALLLLLMIGITLYMRKRQTHLLSREKEKAQAAREEVQEMREKALEARKEADEASAMKMVFIQNMSHEIRTPLNAIVGFSEILANSNTILDEDSRKQFSELISSSSDLMTTLINDILDLSNLTSGQYKMKYSQTTAQKICNAAYTTVKHRTPNNVVMSFDLPEDKKDIVLWTDSSRVEQVLINYLTNACKYTVEGSIRLTYSIVHKSQQQLDSVLFSVTDTGTGIPPEKAESVFKRFEKLDDFKQGNGLGLNICRTIAERLNASCWLDTTYHSGARFFFELPALSEAPEKE